jgi:sterol desaturase/sphingolipid hydroxylase (fatty acid hydroxylase superfamily)
MLSILALFAALLLLEEHQRASASAPIGWRRLTVNWSLGLINIALAALVPVSALVAALHAGSGPLSGWSALAAFLPLLLARSFVAYWLHRLFHAVPLLWRIHRVHHADAAIDTSTGLRNHPFEVLLAAAGAAGVVVVLGPPVGSVVAVDAVLFAAALWQHAAIRVPARLAGLAERILVTPRSHLIHHSQLREQHDRNYGDLLSIWDHLFGTWTTPLPAPEYIGLADGPPNSLIRQLLSPFRDEPKSSASANPAAESQSA